MNRRRVASSLAGIATLVLWLGGCELFFAGGSANDAPSCESAFRTPAADETWMLMSPPPVDAARTAFLIFGQADHAISASAVGTNLHGGGCTVSVPDLTFELAEYEFTLRGASRTGDLDCEIELRGTVEHCPDPELLSGDGGEFGENVFGVAAQGRVVINGQVEVLQGLRLGIAVVGPQPCEAPTTLEGTNWRLTTQNPITPFLASEGTVDATIAGTGQQIASADLTPRGEAAQSACALFEAEVIDGTTTFDGTSYAIDFHSRDVTSPCALLFQGTAVDCLVPPSFSLAPRVLRLEGEGEYQTGPDSGPLTTLFLSTWDAFRAPEPVFCEPLNSLEGTDWTLSSVTVADDSGGPSGLDDSLTIYGTGQIVTRVFASRLGEGAVGTCDPGPDPQDVSVEGDRFAITIAPTGGSDSPCFRFVAEVVGCAARLGQTDDGRALLVQTFLLQGQGEFDFGTIAGTWAELELTVAEERAGNGP